MSLYDLQAHLLASGANKNDRVIVLVEECIESGTTGHNDIVTALDRLNYDRQHVRIMLTKSAGQDPERHHWMKDKAGNYSLHAQ